MTEDFEFQQRVIDSNAGLRTAKQVTCVADVVLPTDFS